MRNLLLVLLVALPVGAMLNLLWGVKSLRRFLAAVPELRSSHHLEQLKRLVSYQMHAALIQIALLGAPLLLFFGGLFAGHLHGSDALWLALPSFAVLAGGVWARRWERAVQQLPASDPTLEREREHIVHVWLTRPLPDWA